MVILSPISYLTVRIQTHQLTPITSVEFQQSMKERRKRNSTEVAMIGKCQADAMRRMSPDATAVQARSNNDYVKHD